jgi:hypothetical protein
VEKIKNMPKKNSNCRGSAKKWLPTLQFRRNGAGWHEEE